MMKREVGAMAVGHIGLNVSDLEISKAFYQEVLGMRVARESIEFPLKYASMAWDGKIVLTLWEQTGGRFKKHRPGLHHLAFEADSMDEINRTKGLLENLGARWSEGSRLYVDEARSAAIHFKDPDGIRIELYTVERTRAPVQDDITVLCETGVNELCAQ